MLTQVTGASPGKNPVNVPSARANRSSTPASSRCATPTGADTAVSSRPCNWPVIRDRAAVPSAEPIGSSTNDSA
jgi:hypothetical protein